MKLIHYILPILAVIGTVACKPKCHDVSNPDCEGYDPCYGKTRINSNFRVREGDGGFKPPEQWCDLMPCDTFNASSVRFDMPLNNPDNSIYTWQIGTEPTPRTGKGFEVDFSDYLDAGKWESSIPVTLTIRTPLNSCMTHAEDTLIKVTRELFFTKIPLSLFSDNQTISSFKGFYTNEPDKEITMTFIDQKSGSFRGVSAPCFLIIGLPFVDTLLYPRTQQNEGCFDYKSSKTRILFPDQNNPKLSFYLSYTEGYFFSKDKIKRIFEFSMPSGFERYEFIGNRLQ